MSINSIDFEQARNMLNNNNAIFVQKIKQKQIR